MTEDNILELAFLEMKELEEKLKSFLSLKFGGAYVLESRVKSMDKMKKKQALYAKRFGSYDLMRVPDIIGFRISVDTEEDVQRIMDLIDFYLRPTRVIDFFNRPKNTGYKAYNCFFEDLEINTEIQIMTNEMRDWTNRTHDEHNARKYGSLL